MSLALSLWERAERRRRSGEGRIGKVFGMPALTRRYAPALSRRERVLRFGFHRAERRDHPEIQLVHTRWAWMDRLHGFIEIFCIRRDNVQTPVIVFDVCESIRANEFGSAHFRFPCA